MKWKRARCCIPWILPIHPILWNRRKFLWIRPSATTMIRLENRENLTVQSPIAGQVYSIDVEVGDTVSAGQTVATVRDASVMSLTVHFPADDAENFYVGQSATVTLDGTFETLTGTISEINGSNTVLTGNVIVRSVTIDVTNPGALSTTQSASAAVGSVTSSDSGTVCLPGRKNGHSFGFRGSEQNCRIRGQHSF